MGCFPNVCVCAAPFPRSRRCAARDPALECKLAHDFLVGRIIRLRPDHLSHLLFSSGNCVLLSDIGPTFKVSRRETMFLKMRRLYAVGSSGGLGHPLLPMPQSGSSLPIKWPASLIHDGQYANPIRYHRIENPVWEFPNQLPPDSPANDSRRFRMLKYGGQCPFDFL